MKIMMMVIIKYTVVGILLNSCGSQDDNDVLVKKVTKKKTQQFVSLILKPYAEAFQAETGADTSKLSLKFVSQAGTRHLAVCWMTEEMSERQIDVDPTWWQGATPIAREQVMYHELGHCAMGLQHRDGHDGFGLPLSIMRSYAFNEDELDYYESQRLYYMNELKQ